MGRAHCSKCGCWRPASDFVTDCPEVGVKRCCEVCKRPRPRVRTVVCREQRRERWRESYRRKGLFDPYLPAAPLQALVEQRLAAGATKTALAARVGVDARAIRHLEKQRFVRLEKADRWALALGANLTELYP